MTSAEQTLTPAQRLLVRCGLARVRRFSSDDSGATAVEFAIVALPFFALMFAILETAMAFFAGQALETSVGDAARLIRTGQAQQSAMTPTAFKQTICDQLFNLLDCDNLHVDVRTFPSFALINVDPPYDEDNNLDPEDFNFDAGESSEIVLVRAYYEWPIVINLLGNSSLSTTGNGKHLLAAAAAFRNEPFPW